MGYTIAFKLNCRRIIDRLLSQYGTPSTRAHLPTLPELCRGKVVRTFHDVDACRNVYRKFDRES